MPFETTRRPEYLGDINRPDGFFDNVMMRGLGKFREQNIPLTPELLQSRAQQVRDFFLQESQQNPNFAVNTAGVDFLTRMVTGTFGVDPKLSRDEKKLEYASTYGALLHLILYGSEDAIPAKQTNIIYQIARTLSSVSREIHDRHPYSRHFQGLLNMLRFTRAVTETDQEFDLFLPDYTDPSEITIDTQHGIDSIVVRPDGAILLIDVTTREDHALAAGRVQRVTITDESNPAVRKAVEQVIRTVYQLDPSEEIDFNEYPIGAAKVSMANWELSEELPSHDVTLKNQDDQTAYLRSFGRLKPETSEALLALLNGIKLDDSSVPLQDYAYSL